MSKAVATPDMPAFLASVRGAAPSTQIQIDDLRTCTIDGVAPRAFASAGSTGDVCAVLAGANSVGAAVVPWGGGQHMGSANRPGRYDVALSLAALDRIVAHEPADMTVTVEPGVRLVDLQRALAKRAQFLPLDPACGDGATVGGVLAANASGPLRHAFGTARDWLIGLRVVHADGSTSKSGGRVVKNVAGYDMHKLHVGAHGSLGVIVEATFKVAPLAAAQRTVAYSCESARAACEMATAAWNAGLALQRMEVLSPEAASHVVRVRAWTLLVEAAGGAGAVDRSDRNLRAVAARGGGAPIAMADDSAWRRWREAFQPRDMFLRTTVLPSEAADTIDTIAAAMSAPARLSATVASGVVRARVDGIDDDASVSLIEGLRRSLPAGAALAAESASPAVRQRIDVFGPARGDIEIMRRLKEQFDPRGVLAPGRVLGRL